MTATAVAGRLAAAKGGLAAPFFVLALVLASLGSTYGIVALWAGAAVAVAASGVAASAERPGWSVIAASVVAYAAIVVLSVLWTSPAYSAAGLFHALLLCSAFAVVRRMASDAVMTVAAGMILFASVLAIWAVADVAYLGMARAHAVFETPSTLATVLNLALLPILVAAMAGTANRVIAVAAILIAAAVFLADSRGGLVALAAGIGFATAILLRGGAWRYRSFAAALALLLAGYLAATVVRALSPVPASVAESADARAGSMHARLELYAISFDAWRASPVLGTGYLTFRYTLEQERARVPSYGVAAETWFVHNDYLQTLQELGPLGLLALLGLVGLPIVQVWRRLPTLPAKNRPAILAICAALVSMAVHALVDFPFYVPVCLLLYGALLGALDRRLGDTVAESRADASYGTWLRAVRIGALTMGLAILLRPVAAELSAAWGLRELSRGHGQSAALWLGAARRIDPRDWRYHWYAGQFWDMQAAESRKRENAELAADAYATGFAMNPLEVRNLLGMISVHRRYRDLLSAPADAQTLRAWAARATEIAPMHPQVMQGMRK